MKSGGNGLGCLFGRFSSVDKLRGSMSISRQSSIWPSELNDNLSLKDTQPAYNNETGTRNQSIKEDDSTLRSSISEEFELVSELTPQQQVATALKNWCMVKSNVPLLENEGAVPKLIELLYIGDSSTTNKCLMGLCYLSDFPEARKHLIERGTIAAVGFALATSDGSRCIHEMSASIIWSLSLCNGSEDQIIEQGVDTAICSIVKESSHLYETCLISLFNLTCVDEPYTNIDKVAKAIISMTPNAMIDLAPLKITAICQCVQFSTLRRRLVDLGALQILAEIGDFDQEAFVLDPEEHESSSLVHQAAISFYNIVSLRSCREETLVHGCGVVLIRMSHISKYPATLYALASTFQTITFSLDIKCQLDLIRQGIIGAIGALLRFPDEENHESISSQCALALFNICAHDGCLLEAVRTGVIDVLIELSCAEDNDTRRMVSILFSKLTSLEEVHASFLERQALPALFLIASEVSHLRGDDDTVLALAEAFLNFSLGSTTRSEAVLVGIMLPLTSFANQFQSAPSVMECCSEAIHVLSSEETNVPLMLRQGVLEALASMVRCNIITVTAQCMAALAMITFFQRSCHKQVMLQEGLIQSIISIIDQSDSEATTRECCYSVLASLSHSEECRNVLRGFDIISCLTKTSKADRESTRRRCATALCNFSMDKDCRCEMISAGVVGLMAELSCTYGESTLRDCAMTISNLAASQCDISTILNQGAMEILLTICVVRSVRGTTRQICAEAFLNLTNTVHLEFIVDSGLVHALEALSTKECCVQTLHVCSCLFLFLTRHDLGLKALSKRSSTLEKLFKLLRARDWATKCSSGVAVCNLLKSPWTRQSAIESGALKLLKIVASLENMDCEIACSSALIALTLVEDSHIHLLNEKMGRVLVLLIQAPDALTITTTLRAIVCFSYLEILRSSVIQAGAVSAIMSIILTGKFPELKNDCIKALRFLSDSIAGNQVLMKERVIKGVSTRYLVETSTASCDIDHAFILKQLTESKSSHQAFFADGGVQLILKLMMRSTAYGRFESTAIICSCCMAVVNLSNSALFAHGLVNAGLIETSDLIISSLTLSRDNESIWCLSYMLFELTEASKNIFSDELCVRGIARSIVALTSLGHDNSKQCCAAALFNISLDAQEQLVELGAIGILAKLGTVSNELTRRFCAMTITNLSTQQVTQSIGTIKSLLKFSPIHQSLGSDIQHQSTSAVPSRLCEIGAHDGYKSVSSEMHCAVQARPPLKHETGGCEGEFNLVDYSCAALIATNEYTYQDMSPTRSTSPYTSSETKPPLLNLDRRLGRFQHCLGVQLVSSNRTSIIMSTEPQGSMALRFPKIQTKEISGARITNSTTRDR